MSGIAIKNYRKVDRGSLLATFTVDTNGTEIRDCRVVKGGADKPWFFTGPQREYEKDGQKKYFDLVRFSDSFKQRVYDAVKPHVEPPPAAADTPADDDSW